MNIGRAAVIGLVTVCVFVTADHRSSTADVPRVGDLARQLIAAIADALPSSERESEGRRLYQTHCASCHGGAVGGNASDYPPRHNSVGHTWQHGDCEIERIVRNGPASTRPGTPPGLQMPAFRDRLTDAEIRDVVAYIKTMWTDDQRASQAATTAASCR